MGLSGQCATDGERVSEEPHNDGRDEACPDNPILVRLRHRAPLIPAKLEGNKLIFEDEVKRPASGQSAVFYDGEICLGGGIII